MLRKMLFFVFAVLLCGGYAAAEKVAIYHTGDVHGWYSARPAAWDKDNSTRPCGGFAVLSTLVKKDKTPHILLDSGDWYQGTPEGNLTKGMASVNIMNLLGYTASAIGNHEYDYGPDNLAKLSKSAKFPLLGANIYNISDGQRVSYAKPYIITKVGGKKIAIIGESTEDTKTSTMPKYVADLDFKNRAQEVAKLIPEIKEKDVDAIVVITHGGLCAKCVGQTVEAADVKFSDFDEKEGNLSIARASSGTIALVLGGHSHTGLLHGYYDSQSGTWFGESYGYLTSVTRAELDFNDKTGKLDNVTVNLVPLWVDTIGEDKRVLRALKPVSTQVSAEMDKVVGYTDRAITRKGKFDSDLGNWVSDIMRETVGADIAFQNTHGIRADIAAGTITIRSIYQVLPFENTLVTMNLTGGQILFLMRENLSHLRSGMQMSGLTAAYTTNEKGDVEEIVITVGGKPIDLAANYKVVTNNYLSGGGTGGATFKDGQNILDTGISIRDCVIDSVRKNPSVNIPAGGRIARAD
ncbi:MAG: bifunctional UDP-sugar hydrolase/5'-nucleotidase [Elusimicrobiaceae bacterium]